LVAGMAFSTLVAQMADRLVVLRRVLMVDYLVEQLADRLVV
jgi:hypothetical protein